MKLIAVTNDLLPVDELIKTIDQIEPYIDGVILREKSKSKDEIIQLINGLLDRQFPLHKIIVHQDPALAKSLNIQHVHLPSSAPPIDQLKTLYPQSTFSRSIHSLQELSEQASWLLYGHIFSTASKKGLAPRGLEALQSIIANATCPIYAIGGIKPGHVKTLSKIGVAGIAVMSSIFSANDPVTVAIEYFDACRLV